MKLFIFSKQSAILVNILLVLMIIAQHSMYFAGLERSGYIMILNSFVLVTVLIYFIQLAHFLKLYYAAPKATVVFCYLIAAGYAMQYLCGLNIRAFGNDIELRARFMSLIMVLGIFIYVFAVVLIVFYIILGHRLLKIEKYPDVIRLGLVFKIVIPVFFLALFASGMYRLTHTWGQLLIVLELLPYWYSYKIYRDAQPAEEIIPDAPVVPGGINQSRQPDL